jgi:hypothetical protein
MNAKGLVATLIVVGGLGMGIRSQSGCDSGPAPDQQLAEHLDEICNIGRANIETPTKGVKKLGRYFAKNLGNITGAFGNTIAAIERIPSDDKHDARARLARDRIHAPVIMCAGDWNRFAEAVMGDPEAAAMVERAGNRLSRTLDILLGKRVFNLRELPTRLMDAFQ